MKRTGSLSDLSPIHALLREPLVLTALVALPFLLGTILSCSDKADSDAVVELSEADAESLWKEAPGAEVTSEEGAAMDHPGGAYAHVCAACHGAKGEGKEEIKSPSIAGLPAWYIEEQFRKFREGERGVHQDDAAGQQMRAIALTLTEEQIKEASTTVSALPIILTEAPGQEAQIEKGRYLFANECMECHRYNGKGEVVFKSAQLISLNRSYLRRQLENFHEGKRGAAETDASGNKMVNVTSGLSDDEIELLVDYIGALAHGDDPRPARER